MSIIGDYFDSDKCLVISVVMVFVIIGAWCFFGYHAPPIQHMTVRVTSERTYAGDFYQRLTGAFITSQVQDIRINGTLLTYTLSCTYYQVNDTLAMTNDGANGYQTDGGTITRWTFDDLHQGCAVIGAQ